MVGDVMCASGPFKLMLDFVEVDRSDLGVRVDVAVEYAGSWQTFRWSVERVWIEYAELRKFEDDLRDGMEARLHDMSDYLLLHFKCTSSEESLTINPPGSWQSSDGGAIMAELKIEDGSMYVLYSSLSTFAKWW